MMPREGTMIADRYRLERKVGGGRVSAMWLVQDQVTDAACAIKLLHQSMNDHPEALARFSLEDRLARQLTGSYFPERIGSGSWHSVRYIAWRWYEGECLRSLFERNPKQDVQTVNSIVQETCQALTVVHGAGYAHGDLKPENLFFTERDEKEGPRQLKLLGFGVASRLARPLLGAQGRRTPGQIVGTPLYLSPELILGRLPRGGQADLWALSVIVYEALTGRAPFLGTDLASVLEAILERQAPRPTSIAENLPGTFDLWWAQALEQEFTTPAEFATGLARALAPALRSSRTQRSASLPDRNAPIAEAFASPGWSAAARRSDPAVSTTTVSSAAAALGAVSASPQPSNAAVAPPRATPAAAAVPPATVAPATVPPATVAPATVAPAPRPPAAARSSAAVRPPAASAPASDALDTPIAPPVVAEPVPRAGSGSVTSSTVAGIGPAALSMMRALETAAAGATAKIHVMPPEEEEEEEEQSFAPLPSPLRDLGLSGSRKTLVGIIPPSTPLGAVPAGTVPASPSGSSAVAPKQTVVIEGKPCRSIELADEDEPSDAPDIMAQLRRPGSPTVPFPRPRAASRGVPRDHEQTADLGPASLAPNSWQRRTTHTLRVVLSDPDHRPHLIAGLVVCAAAALVIFFVGRSPVAGTGPLGQATGALSAESQAPGRSAPGSEEPARGGAPSPAPAVVSELERATADRAAGDPLDDIAEVNPTSPLRGEELAPGLVVPPSGAPPPGAPARGSASPGADTRPATLGPAPNAPAREALGAEASVPPSSDARAPAPKASSKKPGEAAPARRAGGDFDFGI